MDEKMTNYFIANALAVAKCSEGIEDLKGTVRKQIKLNKSQKTVNMILLGLTVLCVCCISDLSKMIKEQDTKLQELEAKINGDEQKGE